MQTVDGVNAWAIDIDDDAVVVSLRVNRRRFLYHLKITDAVQLADQLRLLTKTTD